MKSFMQQLSEEFLVTPIIKNRTENAIDMRKLAVESKLDRRVLLTTEYPPRTQPARDPTDRAKITGSCYLCYLRTMKKRRR